MKGHPHLRTALLGVAIAVAAGAVLAAAARSALKPVASRAPVAVFTVERGATLSQVAHDLEDAGLVRHATAFELYARMRGLAKKLQAGDYILDASLSPETILERIANGRVKTYAVSVPEGLTAVEIAERLEASGIVDAAAFLELVRDPAAAAGYDVEGQSLEGYLFPETYRLARGLSAREVVTTLVHQFHEAWEEIAPQAEANGMSTREIVILASIIEKETGTAEERPRIASVFLNRLRRGMRLESDPTVIYGIPDFDGNLRRRDLENRGNPYNTYRIRGLPPGPIANPGADALRAVLHPEDTDYLYFVSRNDGTHWFSTTYPEHVNAVNRYQKRRRR